jgi:hypothetical protein
MYDYHLVMQIFFNKNNYYFSVACILLIDIDLDGK